MVPTLLVGDELLANKFAYGYGKYSSPVGLMPDFSGHRWARYRSARCRVFRLPRDPSTSYVKRLIGLPGDASRCAQVAFTSMTSSFLAGDRRVRQ